MGAALLYRRLVQDEINEWKNAPPNAVYHSPLVNPPEGFDELEVEEFSLGYDEKDVLARKMFEHVLALGDVEIDGKSFSQWLAYGRSSDWFSHLSLIHI